MKNLIQIEISKKAIENNMRVLRKRVGLKTLIAPCVKANAYGHGLLGVAKFLAGNGADWLCVDSVDEAEKLRRGGIKKPILIIGYIQLSDIKKAISLNTRMFVYNRETVKKLSSAAVSMRKTARVHIKVDTGMSRQGINPNQVMDFISLIKNLPGLELEGIATHFASSDEPLNKGNYRAQIKEINKVIKNLEKKLIKIPFIHSSNSAASLLYPDARFNLVRPGIAVYGYYPSPFTKRKLMLAPRLMPALALKTRVAQVKEIEPGACVSYGCTFTAKKKMKIAVLPIGYYDGLDRKLSNLGEVLIGGKRCRILGRVCMNICVVDVTHIKNIGLEDEVVVIGKQRQGEITIEEVAEKVGTINYEITTRLRENLVRHYI